MDDYRLANILYNIAFDFDFFDNVEECAETEISEIARGLKDIANDSLREVLETIATGEETLYNAHIRRLGGDDFE